MAKSLLGRAGLVLALLALIMTPAAALASPGCAAINSGVLNGTATFAGTGNPTDTGTVEGANVTPFLNDRATTLSFNAGDRVDFSVTPSPGLYGYFRYNTPSANYNPSFQNTVPGSYSQTLPGGVTKVYIYSGRASTATNGTVVASATCAPALPTVTSLNAASGPAVGGASVVITGTSFTGATAVRFGATNASSFTINSDTQITAVAPAGSGTVDVTVVNATGANVTAGSGNDYLFVAAGLAIDAPANGAVLNTTSPTFTGTGTPGATIHVELDVGDGLGLLEYASGTISSGGAWSILIGGLPTGVISLRVREDVSGVYSAYTATRAFTIAGTAPSWTQQTGLYSGVGGGAQIVIDGTNLSGASVTINGTAATVTANTSTQLTFLTPPNPLGFYNVVITTATGTFTIEAGAQYISGISLSTAFDAPSVAVGGSARLTFTLTRPSPNFSRQQLAFSATLPAGLQVAATPNAANAGGCTTVVFAPVAGSGVVALTNGRMNVASCTFSVDVTATTSGAKTVTPGAVSSTVGGTVIAGETPSGATLSVTGSGPTVTALSPATGPVAGGTTVILTGTNFTGATAVSFGSTAAAAFTVNGATSITATAPAGSVGAVDVTVTTPEGTSATSGTGNDFTYVAAPAVPTVTALSPATGPVAGGTTVTLTGTDFAGATAVSFGSAAASAFTVNSATSITATAPAGSAGAVEVTVTTPGGTSATSGTGNDFTYVAAPAPPAAPVVATPANGSNPGDTTPTYTGTAEAGATVDVIVNGTSVGTTTADGGGNWSFAQPTPLSDGSHTIRATATSIGGTSPVSNTNTFTLDTTPPAAPAVATPANGSVINSATPSITGTAEAGSTVTVIIDGAAVGTTTASGSGSWSFTAPALATGSHTVRAIAADAAGNASASSGTNSFSYSPLGLPGGALAGGQVGAAYSAAVTASAGAPPYVYTLTGGALPAGVSLASDGILSGTPTVSGNYAFSVTVTDNNSLTTSGAFTIAVAAPAPPAAAPQTVTVTAGGPQGINLASSVGNAATIEIVSQPSRGSATVSGFVVNYTPAPGYFGMVTFTYKAIGFANGSTLGAESAPATVTITIPNPVLALPGGALPAGQAAVAYSRTLSASGGTAPYAYAVTAGGLPAGISLSPAGVVSGTPTAGGSFSFTVTATDSSTGTGPFTIAGAYTLEIAAPSIVLAPGSLAAGQAAVSYSQTITASGGNGPYTYAITAGALPAGLSLSSAGVLSGTPTAGGGFNFTVTATDSTTGAGPYTGSQAFTLTVNAAAIVVTPTSIPAARRGFAYSQSMSATGGTGAYTWTVSSGALPAGVSLSSVGVLSGTPTVTGTFNVQVSATDSSTGSGPYTGTANLTLVVNAATIIVTPATLPGVMAGLPYDQSISASGGAGAYSYTVTTGALPTGISLSSTGRISGRSYVVGAANFTVTATDAFGNTGSAALVMAILPRPDPSADPDVRAINAAQAEATRRLTSTQIDNFHRRLEQLRTGEADAMSMGVQVQSGIASLDQDADPRNRFGGGRLFDQPAIDPDRAELTAMLWSHDDDERGRTLAQGLSRGPSGPTLNATRTGGGSAGAGGVRVWTGGAITVGDRDAENGQAKFSLTSTGVSIGADLALSPTIDLGFGGGVGREAANVGDLDSRVESNTVVGVMYGVWRPEAGVYIDGVLGYGSLSFDTRRRVTIDNSLVVGDRDGTAWFGSLGVGYDQSVGDGRLSTYGRLESIEADLDAYVETGSPLWALSYDARDVSSLQGVFGGRYVWSRVDRDRIWTPSVRAEFRQELAEGGLQSLGYADVPGGAAYQIEQSGWDRGVLSLGAGLNVAAASGWTASGEVGGRFSEGQTLGTFKLTVSMRF